MKDILLTIGIPTYNGEKYIKETLESIIMQLAFIDKERIEILVSDNNSTDKTEIIINEFLNQYPDIIKYYKNDFNIGYDRNVDNIFKKAKGKFVELLGDDDYYTNEKSVYKIFNVIEEYNNLNVLIFGVNFLDINTGIIQDGTNFKEELLCGNGDVFLRNSMWNSAALSSIVIKTDEWNKISLEKYFGTQWIHVGAIINILNGNKESYIYPEKLVIVRRHNPRWENNFGNQLKCGIEHLGIFEDLKNLDYEATTYEMFLNDRYKSNFYSIIDLRPKKLKEKILVLRKMSYFFKKFPMFWILHIPFMFLPSVIIVTLKKIKKVFNLKGEK